jgi:hypothetical protein
VIDSLVFQCKLTLLRYVGEDAGRKPVEFVTALMFAQDYGILAASLEDRQSIPPCSITFYGVPSDFTPAFRKWEKNSGMGSGQQKACQVITLNDAVEALRR